MCEWAESAHSRRVFSPGQGLHQDLSCKAPSRAPSTNALLTERHDAGQVGEDKDVVEGQVRSQVKGSDGLA